MKSNRFDRLSGLARCGLLWACAAIVSVGPFSSCRAGPLQIGQLQAKVWKFTVTNEYVVLASNEEDVTKDVGATTYNLSILNVPITMVSSAVGKPLGGQVGIPNAYPIRLQTQNVTVKRGETQEMTVEFKRVVNEIRVSSVWSHTDGSFNFQKVVQQDGKDVADDLDENEIVGDGAIARINGFKAGNPSFTLFNDLSVPLEIRNLGFLVNVSEIDPETLDPTSLGGFDDLFHAGPISLSANGGFFDVLNIPEIDLNNYLYARWDVYNPETGQHVASSVVGIQAVVPEPSTIVLLGTGALCLSGYLWRKRIKSGFHRANP